MEDQEGRTLSRLAELLESERTAATSATSATSEPQVSSQYTDPDLPRLVRQRLGDACRTLKIKPAPVLKQLDLWAYRKHELEEILGWPEATVQDHCRLLNREAEAGIDPRTVFQLLGRNA